MTKKKRKRNIILEKILEDLDNEFWYDKVRRNINFIFNHRIYRSVFYRVFGKK